VRAPAHRRCGSAPADPAALDRGALRQIVDLVAEGMIDPAMVTRSALQSAASIAKNILTTEAIVA